MKAELLIHDWILQTEKLIAEAEKLKTFDIDVLRWRADNSTWCVLECLEHLNLYGDFYLPQIETKINNAKAVAEPEFTSGLLGGYFSKAMLPKEKTNKMKTFKNKNPIHSNLSIQVIDRFINQQKTLLLLISQSKKISLNKVKISTTISSLINLRLGDAFQFLINHNIRHFNQINRILQTIYENKQTL